MATNQMRREAAKRKLANQQAHRAERIRRRRRSIKIASISTVLVVALVAAGIYVWTIIPPSTSGTAPGVALPKRPTALPASVSCAYKPGEQPAKPATRPADGQVSAQGTVPASLETSSGDIGLTLDRTLAPCAVNSFVDLAKQGYFNDTTCHRLTTGEGLQVLQCGDPSGQGTGGPGYTFADELFPGLKYGRGLLAMANAGPNSNGSQFFMIFGDAELPPNYTVFGSIDLRGLTTLDQIAKAGDDSSNGPGDGKPNEAVTIETATAG